MRAPWELAGRQSWFELCRHGGGGGGASTSSSMQSSTSQDNRAGADTGSIAATTGATVAGVTINNQSYNVTDALPAVLSSNATVQDIASAALQDNAGLSADAISAWEQSLQQELQFASSVVGGANTQVINAATQENQMAQAALAQSNPSQEALKFIIVAASAVAIVFFLSRSA